MMICSGTMIFYCSRTMVSLLFRNNDFFCHCSFGNNCFFGNDGFFVPVPDALYFAIISYYKKCHYRSSKVLAFFHTQIVTFFIVTDTTVIIYTERLLYYFAILCHYKK